MLNFKLSIVALASLALLAALAMSCAQADLGEPYSADELMAAYLDSPDDYETDWLSKRVNVTGTVAEISRAGDVYLSTSFDGEEVILVGLADSLLDETIEGDLVEFACAIGEYSRGAIEMTRCGPAEYGGAAAADSGSGSRDTEATGLSQYTAFWSVPFLLIAAVLTIMAVVRSNWAGMQPAMVVLMALNVVLLAIAAAYSTLEIGLDSDALHLIGALAFPLTVIMGWIILDPARFAGLSPAITGASPPPPPAPPPPAFTAPPSATQAGGGMGATAVGPAGGFAPANAPSATMAMQPDVARSMAWVVVTRGPSEGKSMQLKEGNNTIGRALDNDLQIDDASVSRAHAMLSVKSDEFTLVDLGSASGTRIGGYRISGSRVSAGGVITVGRTTLGLMNVDVTHGTPSSGATIVGSSSGHSLSLIAQSGPDAGRSFPLPSAQNVIGRDPSAQVTLSDPTVSRQHAMIRVDADRTTVSDLGSMSGTSVNGEVIKGVRISAGDRVTIGQSEFTLMMPSVQR